MIKIKKDIQLIDQHDSNGMWGGKFGGNYIPETLKKPIDDLTNLFAKREIIILKITLGHQRHLLDLIN